MTSGGESGNFGFNGSFGGAVLNNNTVARIAEGSTIVVGSKAVGDDDANGASLFVNATNSSIVVTTAGALTESQSTGVGASLAVNVSLRHTEALIGDTTGTATSAGSLTVGGDVLVHARNSGFIGSFAVAGSKTSSAPETPSNTASDPGITPYGTGGTQGSDGSAQSDSDLLNWQTGMLAVLGEMKANGKVSGNVQGSGAATDQASKTTEQAKTGYAISGAVTVNFIHDDALAYLRNIISLEAQSLKLDTNDSTMIGSLAGSVAIVSTKPNQAGVGIAAGVSINVVTGKTAAYVDGADLTLRSLAILSDRDGWVVSLAAGVAGATGKKGYAIGGSVGFTHSETVTEAALRNATGLVDGPVTVEANDDTNIIIVAGAGGFGGKAGVGAAIAFSDISNKVISQIENVTDFTHHGNVDVGAIADGMIISVVGAVGVATGGGGEQGYGIGGTIAVNYINNEVDAAILNSTTLSGSTGNVSLLADDSSAIYSMGGGFAYGKSAGIGLAFAINLLDNKITSRVEGSTLVTTGNLSSEAKEHGNLVTVSVGGPGS